METEVSLPYSPMVATCPYHETEPTKSQVFSHYFCCTEISIQVRGFVKFVATLLSV
jgi:hypothetical protein